MSPHEALYGFRMNPLPRYTIGDSNLVEVDSFLGIRKVLNTELSFYLQTAQPRMKKQADSKRRDKEFQEGD